MKHGILSLFVVFSAAAGCGYNSVQMTPSDDLVDGGADGSVEMDSATADGSMEMDAGVDAVCVPGPMGHLTVEAIPVDEPVCNQLVMGQTDKKVARFRFTADEVADVNVWNVTTTIRSADGSVPIDAVRNIRIVDEVGEPLDMPNGLLGESGRNVFSPYLEIPAGTSRQIAVVTDIPTYFEGVASGVNFFVSIHGDGFSVYAVSQTAESCRGAVLDADHITYVPTDELHPAPSGPTYFVYRTRPIITVAPMSPLGGTASPSSGQVVGIWRVTNLPNAGNFPLWFGGFIPELASTITVRNGGDLRLYWDGIAPANEYLHIRYRSGTTIGAEPIESGSGDNFYQEIPAGGHRDMYAVVDTTDAGINQTLTPRLDPDAPYIWIDEPGEMLNTFTVCDLPTSSVTFRY